MCRTVRFELTISRNTNSAQQALGTIAVCCPAALNALDFVECLMNLTCTTAYTYGSLHKVWAEIATQPLDSSIGTSTENSGAMTLSTTASR